MLCEVPGTGKVLKELPAEERKQETINPKIPFDKCPYVLVWPGRKATAATTATIELPGVTRARNSPQAVNA